MGDDKAEAETLRTPSFEETVLNQLGAIGVRLDTLETRLRQMESDIKPIHSGVVELNSGLNTSFGNLERKLDVMNKELFQLKADHVDIETRLEKIESEVNPQIIVQERQF